MKHENEHVADVREEAVDAAEQAPQVQDDENALAGVSRRGFLGGLGVAAGAATAIGANVAPGAVDSAEAAEVLDPFSPQRRRWKSFRLRFEAASNEFRRRVDDIVCNGDEDLYPNRIGNFHKGLPHDETTGEVDPAAYDAMTNAIESGKFEDFDLIPGTRALRLLNPLGGLGYNSIGPDNRVATVPAPPPLASGTLNAQMAELYWMALTRDIPFVTWGTDPTIAAACRDLSARPDYVGPRNADTGQVTPQELFRIDSPGVLDGPIVSNFLYRGFIYDAIFVQEPKILRPLPGQDFMTDWASWLEIQNGAPNGNPGFSGTFDPENRFPYAGRDLGHIAGQDAIYSAFFRASLILRVLGFGGRGLFANYPYKDNPVHIGFATMGFADLVERIASAAQSERPTWYYKWNVHRFLRPESYGGLVQRVMTDGADYPIDTAMLNGSEDLLDRIFAYNEARNAELDNGSPGTYLLPQMFRQGSPVHPSYPAGHGISAGACITILKAWYDPATPFPTPRKPTEDGLSLEPYVAGTDGPLLTVGGELNKLAHNLSHGRDISGVHWRADSFEAILQGEQLAIDILREAKPNYPEPFEGWNLVKFDGTEMVI
ncbi:MAG: vanadium-dependent haloperoxidase [Acidobacteriota bacterium]